MLSFFEVIYYREEKKYRCKDCLEVVWEDKFEGIASMREENRRESYVSTP